MPSTTPNSGSDIPDVDDKHQKDNQQDTTDRIVVPENEEDGYFRQTWKGKIWDSFDRPPAERKLLFKLDAIVLTFASVRRDGTALTGIS
jgi:hypothetical protein